MCYGLLPWLFCSEMSIFHCGYSIIFQVALITRCQLFVHCAISEVSTLTLSCFYHMFSPVDGVRDWSTLDSQLNCCYYLKVIKHCCGHGLSVNPWINANLWTRFYWDIYKQNDAVKVLEFSEWRDQDNYCVGSYSLVRLTWCAWQGICRAE